VTTVITWGLVSILGSSFAVCALLILTQRWHGRLPLDHDLSGAQKIHQFPVPRVGGLGIAVGLCMGAFAGFLLGGTTYPLILKLLLSASPVFIAGFLEDLTKRVSVRMRLNASFASAGMAAWLLGAHLSKLDTPGLDAVISVAPLSILFTCFAVGGITHAVNIIDGLNGLAAGCVALMLTGLAIIAWQVGDIEVMKLCLWGVAALMGFLILNFPFGRIFLGDGGAYLAGFWLAECGILLLNRNPTVSTWAVLLCCVYPFWETIFSIYRRHVLNRVSSGSPDMIHFHHLVYSHISRTQVSPFAPTWLKHCLSSLSIWLITAFCSLLAINAYSDTQILILCVCGFVFLYNLTYRYMLRSTVTRTSEANVLIQAERP